VSPPHDTSGLAARYTPDDARRRRLVALAASVGAVLAWYGATAVITGVKSGLVYNVAILVLLLATFTGGTRRMPRPLRSGRKPTIDDTIHATMAVRPPSV
jgi:hypothetical protein